MDENGKAALKDTHLAWIKYLNAEKDFLEQYYTNVMNKAGGGTMYLIFLAHDEYAIVRSRTIQLMEYYNSFIASQE